MNSLRTLLRASTTHLWQSDCFHIKKRRLTNLKLNADVNKTVVKYTPQKKKTKQNKTKKNWHNKLI